MSKDNNPQETIDALINMIFDYEQEGGSKKELCASACMAIGYAWGYSDCGTALLSQAQFDYLASLTMRPSDFRGLTLLLKPSG